MKDGNFETQQEIFNHLVNDMTILHKNGNEYCFVEGFLTRMSDGKVVSLSLSHPEMWRPKPKEVTITRDDLAKAWDDWVVGCPNPLYSNYSTSFKEMAGELGL